MADKVDMSLDDIIKLTKVGRRGRSGTRGGGGGGGGGAGGTRGFRSRGSGPRGGGGTRGRGFIQKRRSASFGRTRNLDDDTMWEHDMFDGSNNQRKQIRTDRPQQRFNQNSEGHLMVSNLDFAVNDSDIYELFAECGPLKRAVINYDRSARSMGTAEVVFERRSDAIKAMKQYNNVPLDGLPMKIEMIGAAETNGASYGGGFRDSAPRRTMGRRNDFDDRPRRGGARGGGGGGGGGGRGRGGGGRGRGGRDRKVPTAEELDAQLDAYTSKMETD